MLLRVSFTSAAAHGYALRPECGYDTARTGVLGTADFLSTSRLSPVSEIFSGSFHRHDECIPYPPSLDLGRGCSRGATCHRTSLHGSVPSSRLHPTHASSAAAATLLIYTRLQRTTARYDPHTTTPWTAPRRLLSVLSATPQRPMRTTPVRIQHPPCGSASSARRRLRSTSCVLDLPRLRSSAASIPRSPAAVAALRRGGGFPQQSPWERSSGSKAERRRGGTGGCMGREWEMESMSSLRSRSRSCWNRARTGYLRRGRRRVRITGAGRTFLILRPTTQYRAVSRLGCADYTMMPFAGLASRLRPRFDCSIRRPASLPCWIPAVLIRRSGLRTASPSRSTRAVFASWLRRGNGRPLAYALPSPGVCWSVPSLLPPPSHWILAPRPVARRERVRQSLGLSKEVGRRVEEWCAQGTGVGGEWGGKRERVDCSNDLLAPTDGPE
ncbi:hypothetical protein C8R45DRAFT_598058 [Mycena sanguinolenta]|nr:hypothetical protein C8R45DRAFT_598058 [Mycena sanguinolenta]